MGQGLTLSLFFLLRRMNPRYRRCLQTSTPRRGIMKDKTARRTVVALFTGVLTLMVILVMLGYHQVVHAAEGPVLVSKKAPGLYVQIIFHPGIPKSTAAKEKWKQLSDGLKQEFQSVARTQRHPADYAECNVVLRDWTVGESNFQSACFSAAMWHEDSPLVFLDLPETVEDVLRGLRTFALNHQMRLNRSKPMH